MRALPAKLLILVLAIAMNGCFIRTHRRYRWGWQPYHDPSGNVVGAQVIGGSLPLP
jgi:hypothetical protein